MLRRFDVPLKIKLNRLHDVIQAAMGWTDSHLYEFRAGGSGWGVPDSDGFYDGPMPASKTSLLDVIEDVATKTIHYIYYFGDNWHHVIKIEKIDGSIAGAAYPRLVRVIGACPPEDVGGFPGYADFLDAIADPKHEEHNQMLEWYGGQFDPDEAEIGRIVDNLASCQKMRPETAQTKSRTQTPLINTARPWPSPNAYARNPSSTPSRFGWPKAVPASRPNPQPEKP